MAGWALKLRRSQFPALPLNPGLIPQFGGVFLHNIAKLSSDHSSALFQHQDENIMTMTYVKWILNIK